MHHTIAQLKSLRRNREVAAYLLDFDHFANVPSTTLAKISHPIFNVNDRVNGDMNQSGKLP